MRHLCTLLVTERQCTCLAFLGPMGLSSPRNSWTSGWNQPSWVTVAHQGSCLFQGHWTVVRTSSQSYLVLALYPWVQGNMQKSPKQIPSCSPAISWSISLASGILVGWFGGNSWSQWPTIPEAQSRHLGEAFLPWTPSLLTPLNGQEPLATGSIIRWWVAPTFLHDDYRTRI